MLITPSTYPQALELLSQSDLIAVDTETYFTDDWEQRKIIGVSTFCRLEDNRPFGAYFPFRHEPVDCNLPLEQFKLLVDVLNRPTAVHLFHNAKFDRARFVCEGYPLTQPFFDTMIMSHMYDENNSHVLEDLSERFKIDMESNKRKKQLHALRQKIVWHKLPVELMADYAVGDVRNTYYLFQILKIKLEKQELMGLWPDQMKFNEILTDMELLGIQIDRGLAKKRSEEALQRMWAIEKELGFDPGKPLQLATRLFIDLKLPIKDRGKPSKQFPNGRPTMNEKTLSDLGKLVPDNSTVRLVLEYRGLQKARSTWYDGWRNLADSSNILHANFNQHGTVSTRLSSSNPNMQQIPSDMTECPVLDLIVPRDGYEIWSFDYSQLEYRIATTYSGQESMVDAYLRGSDFHSLTSTALGIDRRLAKTVNFCVLYGGGPGKLAQILGIELSTGRAYLDKFRSSYPKLVDVAERCNAKAARQGYVKLWTGHRCRFTQFYETKDAWNRVIQGGGAQIVREAACRIAADTTISGRIINMIHDAFWVEIPKGKSMYDIPKIVYAMSWPSYTNEEFWKIPYEVDYKQIG